MPPSSKGFTVFPSGGSSGHFRAAGDSLAEGGRVHIVDFGDFRTMPRPAAAILRSWLRHFHVAPREGLLRGLEKEAFTAPDDLRIWPGRYAFCWSGGPLSAKVLANVAGRPQAAEIS